MSTPTPIPIQEQTDSDSNLGKAADSHSGSDSDAALLPIPPLMMSNPEQPPASLLICGPSLEAFIL